MLFTAVTVLAAAAAPQEQPVVPASTRLDRVTVYAAQALVERTFAVEADAPGPMTVEIGPLPLGLDVSSFQTKVEAGQAVIQGVETRIVTGDALDRGQRDQLRARLAEMLAERRDLDAERASIEAGQQMVASVIASLATPDGGARILESAVDGTALDALFAFVRERSAELDRELAALEAAVAELEQRIAGVRAELGGENGAPLRRYHLGRIQVWAERAGRVELRASYLIGGARWRPTYDVRVAPDLTGVTVGLVAELDQRTGEDWTDAEVLLSTSTPSVGLDPPPVPLRVFEIQRATPSSVDARALDRGGAAFAEVEGLALPNEAAKGFRAAPEAQIQDLGLSALFQLPDRKTIRGDGEPYRYRIREVPLEVRPERYLVPSRSDRAYLRAEVRLTGDTPLLPGQAKIFLGPDYLGDTRFPVLRPGDSTTLNLGVDPNLAVELEVVRDERDDPGLLSSTATITRVWRAKLKLSAAALGAVDVLVEEALPVVRGGGLEIKPVELRPNPLRDEADLRDQRERGVFRWRLRLAPGQGQNVYWGYELEFDEDLTPVLTER
jgi:uncharacterized protein (TIGR02231 family)